MISPTGTKKGHPLGRASNEKMKNLRRKRDAIAGRCFELLWRRFGYSCFFPVGLGWKARSVTHLDLVGGLCVESPPTASRGGGTKKRIFEFPQQLASLRYNLTEFVSILFAENIYQDTPLLRGVYLTSGTQEGRPIDRITNAMASAFGVQSRMNAPAPAVETKSYFLHDLFAKVIFPDRKLAGHSTNLERRLRIRRYAIAGTSFGVAALLLLLPGYAYLKNRELVGSTAAQVDRMAGGGNESDTLGQLDALRERVAQLHEWESDGAPLAMRFGMYRGDDLYAPPEGLAMADRLLLHATMLGFTHPTDARPMVVTSDPPF